MKKYGLFLLVPVELLLQSFFKGRGWGTSNSGISFGLLAGIPVGLLFVGLILLWLFLKSWPGRWWQLVLVGGAANLLSRLLWDGVWDYLPVPLVNLWFNGADMAIFLGIVGLLFLNLNDAKS